MNILAELRNRFAPVLADLVPQEQVPSLLDTIRRSQDPKFGDYQVNCAMSLKAQLGKPPREIAQAIVEAAKLDDLAESVEVAGPGFINVRLKDSWIEEQFRAALTDERLGVGTASEPRTYIIDYSSPNVAKPMHVGHIRSTVIGASLARMLTFVGHQVITDNHIGDWGTQFGMIIYGYKHFLNAEAYEEDPVGELGRLYRLVRQFMDYHDAVGSLPKRRLAFAKAETDYNEAKGKIEPEDKKEAKVFRKHRDKLKKTADEAFDDIVSAINKITPVEANPQLKELAKAHPGISQAVLAETVKLHQGDEENLALWNAFMPPCLESIEEVYERFGVTFDHTLGESFYHDQLGDVVADLQEKGIATTGQGGAVIVEDDRWPAPMLIQKQDGAFLYGTTDLATIAYRMKHFKPDAVLYVVDFRQGLHFQQLFDTAARWGFDQLELKHIQFGTVMGPDGKPFRTRAGDTVGLSGLLDEAESHALKTVSEKDDTNPQGPQLSPEDRVQVSKVVGMGALVYFDLSHDRTSNYTFDYARMLDLNGNTATYLQYAYARVRSILRKSGVSEEEILKRSDKIDLTHPTDRALALQLVRFEEDLTSALVEYYPHLLCDGLYSLGKTLNTFHHSCPVLAAETESLKFSRLLLCLMTGRVMKLGLKLLGIGVAERL